MGGEDGARYGAKKATSPSACRGANQPRLSAFSASRGGLFVLCACRAKRPSAFPPFPRPEADFSPRQSSASPILLSREVDSVAGLRSDWLTALPDAPPSEVAVETSAEPIDLEAQLISVIGQEHATAVMALLNDGGSKRRRRCNRAPARRRQGAAQACAQAL